MVLAEFKLDDPKASTILLDYTTGIHAAVDHLAALGHRKIGFLAGPHKLHSAITRENDFRDRHAGQQTARSRKSGSSSATTRSRAAWPASASSQSSAARPTAVICSNDMTAIGVLRAAYMRACACRRISP